MVAHEHQEKFPLIFCQDKMQFRAHEKFKLSSSPEKPARRNNYKPIALIVVDLCK